jgi:hypothetical protein
MEWCEDNGEAFKGAEQIGLIDVHASLQAAQKPGRDLRLARIADRIFERTHAAVCHPVGFSQGTLHPPPHIGRPRHMLVDVVSSELYAGTI